MQIHIIGGGNLGTAIAKGVKKGDKNISISVSRRNISRIETLKELGIEVTRDNLEFLPKADVVILAVKPQQMPAILKEIGPKLKKQVLVSVATGYSIENIEKNIKKELAVFRVMPNTAIAFQESMTCIAYKNATSKQIDMIEKLFKMLGEVIFIDEKMVDAATVLGACGVAFALRYIRAAMQGGIQIGFDSETALKIVSQTSKGAAALLLQGNSHPEREIDKVTTPQGCTIAGLNEMEFQGFSSALIKGITTSFEEIDTIKNTK